MEAWAGKILAATKSCSRKIAALLLLAATMASQGCAALSNPVANGLPVRCLTPELLGESRENMETIPLSSLRQPRTGPYVLAPGDVLGIWIEGILGEKGQAPPVRLSELGNQPASVGFPIPVRDNGTISLPLVPAIKVEGKTLEQAEEAIKKAYSVDQKILLPNRERILVTLQRPRQYHILVIRQDSATPEGGAGGGAVTGGRATGFVLNVGGGSRGSRRGTGYAIDLPAYENDVLNALAHTGGFPGSDATNEIIIERGGFEGQQGRADLLKNPQVRMETPTSIRIPLRYRPGQMPAVQPQDVVLQTGDIVYIQAREADVFYTAGLLPAGEYVLPRDSDLNVVEALARVGGSTDAGGINTLNINGTLTLPGIGNPSPTLVSVIRRTPEGGQVTIQVDLDRALRDPRERILIQPRDIIVLQERPDEGVARYITQKFGFNAIYQLIKSSRANVSTSLTNP